MKELGLWILIFIGAYTGACMFVSMEGGNPFASAYSSHHFPSQGGSSVVGQPSISAEKINQILENAGSTAKGTGGAMHGYGQYYNIDSAFALAFFKHESSFGTSGMAVQTKSLGNIRCSDGYRCIEGFRAYSSWADGYKDWFTLISGPYYVGAGLTTPAQIIAKYAPSSDNNNPVAYAQDVESSVARWRAS